MESAHPSDRARRRRPAPSDRRRLLARRPAPAGHATAESFSHRFRVFLSQPSTTVPTPLARTCFPADNRASQAQRGPQDIGNQSPATVWSHGRYGGRWRAYTSRDEKAERTSITRDLLRRALCAHMQRMSLHLCTQTRTPPQTATVTPTQPSPGVCDWSRHPNSCATSPGSGRHRNATTTEWHNWSTISAGSTRTVTA